MRANCYRNNHLKFIPFLKWYFFGKQAGGEGFYNRCVSFEFAESAPCLKRQRTG